MSLFQRLFGTKKPARAVETVVAEPLPLAEDLVEEGATPETAIAVASIAAEYQWVKANCPGFRPAGQSLVQDGGKAYDRLTLRHADGRERKVYFDISSFFGR